MSGDEGAGQAGQQQRSVIALDDLGIEQLGSLQKQLEREIEFFTESVTQLRTVASKMADSGRAVAQLKTSKSGDTALIPLSESMYIRASLSDPNKTLVDIGTGYYAEMSAEQAVNFFDRKHKYIIAQVDKVETLLRDRQATRAKITERFQQKVRAALATQPSP